VINAAYPVSVTKATRVAVPAHSKTGSTVVEVAAAGPVSSKPTTVASAPPSVKPAAAVVKPAPPTTQAATTVMNKTFDKEDSDS